MGRGDGDARLAAIAFHRDGELTVRVALDAGDEFAPQRNRLAIDGDDPIARAKSALLGGPSRFDAADQGQPVETDAEFADGVRILDVAQPILDPDLVALRHAGANGAKFDRPRVAQPAGERQAHVRPSRRLDAVHGHDLFAGRKARPLRRTLLGDAADDGHQRRNAHDGDQPEHQERQHEVRGRTGKRHGDAPPRSEHVVGLRRDARRMPCRVPVAPVVHPHVAAEGNGGNAELRAAPVVPGHQRPAEPHRKTHDVQASPPGHQEMPHLVEGHQYDERDQQIEDVVEVVHG